MIKSCDTCNNRGVPANEQPCAGCWEGGVYGAYTPDPALNMNQKPAQRSIDDATPAEWTESASKYFARIGSLNRSEGPMPITMLDKEISPLALQVAGDHYKGKKIQPVEYISANRLNFLEGCIVKRITRWRDKEADNRFQDLEKIKHEVDLLIEMEKRHG